jgi:predicted DNA-binding ribbon-helix-helix protein
VNRTSTSRLSAQYLDNTILLSAESAWTYVRLPLISYEFQSYDQRVALAETIATAVSSVLTDSTKPVECHLRIIHRPFAAQEWYAGLHKSSNGATSGWKPFSLSMANHVAQQDYLTKQVYLGIRLGSRRDQGSLLSLVNPLKGLSKLFTQSMGIEDLIVEDSEIDYWTKSAQQLRAVLSDSHLKAQSAPSEEVALLITSGLWTDLDQPEPTSSDKRTWGAGELLSLTDCEIKQTRKHLEITQQLPSGDFSSGFIATLSASRFPDVLKFPDQEPWIHMAARLGFPVDFSIRFTVVPFQAVKKDISKKLADARDQAQHIAESGTSVPLKVREQLQVSTVLEYELDKTRAPWMYAAHRLIVTASTQDELNQRARSIIEAYRELGIDIVWSTGEQMELLLEAMPADKVRSNAYLQRQELFVLSGGMPTANSQVGDLQGVTPPVSCYLGHTTSRVLEPVFFSPHTAMARNYPPGVAITGAPGGGKSYLAFTLAHQMAMQGVWTIYLDPKADAKPMADAPGLDGARVFDLREGNTGMLDPFSLGGSTAESMLLAMETLRLLLGGSLSEEREESLLHSLEYVAKKPEPSLSKVVDNLVSSENTASRNLGSVLRTIRDLPFASLCFAATSGPQLKPEDGLTIVTLLGIDLPNAQMRTEDYSYENRLAVSVMYLLTRYARQLMLNLDKSHPKAICVDEAWAITSTPQGAKLIPEIARMGRSHNTALILVSQNASDLMEEAVTNSISTKFAFRSSIPSEIRDVFSLFALADDQGYETAVRDLRNGECLMQDMDGRVSRVQIDAWDEGLFNTFNTNPETRGKTSTK